MSADGRATGNHRKELHMKRFSIGAGLALSLGLAMSPAEAQRSGDRPAGFELYGHVMADAILDQTGMNPTWLGAARPSQLPSFENQYGDKGNFFFGVGQSRVGIRPHIPTPLGEITAKFEIDFFGVGPDAGQTTIRLRHAYAQLGQFGFGQTESPFMDIDVFPNQVDYWGPHGMILFRNVQFRWTPVSGKNQLMFALERPGASGDEGDYAGRVELEDVRVRFPMPDLSGAFKFGMGDRGYLRLGAILRYTEWDDVGNQPFDLSGDAVGWGVNASTNLRLGQRAMFRGQVTYGEGIQNYMNDSPVDLAADPTGDPNKPLTATPLPLTAFSAFLDLNWNPKWTSTIGYSATQTDNTEGQTDEAFEVGQYGAVNLLWYPVPNLFVGPELIYMARSNFKGFDTDGIRLQISAKYSFSTSFGGR
jgi:hypothetical protein